MTLAISVPFHRVVDVLMAASRTSPTRRSASRRRWAVRARPHETTPIAATRSTDATLFTVEHIYPWPPRFVDRSGVLSVGWIAGRGQQPAHAGGLAVNTKRSLPASSSRERRTTRRSYHQRLEAMVVVWIAFLVFIFFLLALDLGVFHRKAHVVSVREALTWSVRVGGAGAGVLGIRLSGLRASLAGPGGRRRIPSIAVRRFPDGRINDGWSAFPEVRHRYCRGILSVDNVFVIAMLFRVLCGAGEYQHRVLFWGIVGVGRCAA